MSEPTPDHASRDAAENELEKNIFLEASAGTGKTTTLTNRIVRLITTDTARIDQIAAITFTEAATSELKSRVRGSLQKYLDKDLPPDQRNLVVAALRDIDLARISTLHSFAFSLLRERPIEAGIDPGAVGLDQVQTDELFDNIWSEWIGTQMAIEEHTLLSHLVAYNIRIADIEKLAKSVYGNRDITLDSQFEHPAPTQTLQQIAITVENVAKALREEAEKGVQRGQDIGVPDDDTATLYLKSKISEVEHYEHLHAINPQRALFYFVKTVKASGHHTAIGKLGDWGKQNESEKRAIASSIKPIKDDIETAKSGMSEAVSSELLDFIKDFIDHITKVKRDSGVLDFMDLLMGARDLLRENTEVRSHFQNQIKTLLIDEFQDTDPIQAEIAFFLAEDGANATNWEQVKLRPGRLFIVGDPKQSIYRFRRADIELFQWVREQIEKQGGLYLELTHNFRSVPGVIEWVNSAFHELIIEPPPEEPRHQPKYTDMSPSRKALKAPSVYELPHRTPSQPGPFNSTIARELEAESVATFIGKVLSSKHPIQDSESDEIREATPGDIALLFRSTSDISVYTNALEEYGIPYRVEGGKTYYNREEVRAVTAALSLIADPTDNVAFIATARSFLFGVSDTELLAHKNGGGRFTALIDKVDDQKTPALAALLVVIEVLRSKVNELSTPQLIGELYRLTGAIEVATTRNASQQRVQNLMKIQELAGTRSHSPGLSSLRSFALWIDSMSTSSQEESESPAADETEQQVTLMTIHKSKGLAFNIVVLADMNKRPGGGGNDALFLIDKENRTFGYKIGSEDKGNQILSPDLEELKVANKLCDDSEGRRVYYVAATRARDLLVYSSQKRVETRRNSDELVDKSDGFNKLLETEAAAARQLATPWEHEPAPPDRQGNSDLEKVSDVLEAVEKAKTRWAEKQEFLAEKVNTVGHLGTSQLKGDSSEVFKGSSHGQGKEFGSALHRVMELIDLSEKDEKSIDLLLRQAADEFELNAHSLEALGSQVRRALDHPTIMRAAASPHVLRELPFTIKLNKVEIQNLAPEVYDEISDRLQDEVTIDGIIDLLFEEDGQLVIVDYKTDAVEGDDLATRAEYYKPQIDLYRKAAGELTGMPVAESSLLFTQ